MVLKKSLFFSFFFIFTAVFSQEESKEILLTDFLLQTEKNYDVKFSFSVEEVSKKHIILPKDTTSIEDVINYLNAKTILQFTKIDDRYITVSRLNKVISVCGKVLDFIDNSPISLATIMVENSEKGATTDEKGFFFIENILASDTLKISFLGYKSILIKAIDVRQKDNCEIVFLKEASVELNEIVIERFFTAGLQKNSDGSVTLNTESFGILPGLIQPDILQTVKVLPGVESVNETISNINVRGGTNDQNLIIWDGIKMYHYGHFFGLISAYNPYLTNKVSIYKNGTSSEFSDGVSSTIVMETKNVVDSKFSGAFGFDLLSTDFLIRTPITKKIALHISARRSFTDFINTPTYQNYFDRSFQENTVSSASVKNTSKDFYFYDYSLKFLYDININHSLRINYIHIKNSLDYQEHFDADNSISTDKSNLEQENLGSSIVWNADWSARFSTKSTFFYSKYKINSSDFNRENNQFLKRENDVLETGFKITTKYKLTKNFDFINGFDFNEIGVKNMTSVNAPEFFMSDKDVLIKNALFSEIEFNKKGTYARVGLRTNHFSKFNLFLFEPRINIRQKISNSFFSKLEAEIKHQSIAQKIDFEDNFLGVEKRRWVLSDEKNIPIIKSKQLSIGVDYSLKDFQIDVTGFYKKVEDITVSNQGFYNNVQNLNAVGSYTVKGIEFIANKKINHFSSWLSYTYSKNNYNFSVFSPNIFLSNLDITHSLNAAITYKLNKNIDFSIGSVLRTGKPFTNPVTGNETIENGNKTIVNYDAPNQNRLPNFFRLDASTSYKFSFYKDVNMTFRAGITNILDRKNIINSYYVVDENSQTNTKRVNNLSLPFTPNISFRVDF